MTWRGVVQQSISHRPRLRLDHLCETTSQPPQAAFGKFLKCDWLNGGADQ